MQTRSRLEICLQYSSKIRAATRILRVLPLERAGQTIVAQNWHCEPKPTNFAEKLDRFGNRVLILRHQTIEKNLRFELNFEAQSTPILPDATPAAIWKMPSRLVRFFPISMPQIARARALSSLQRAHFWQDFVFQNLNYQWKNDPFPLDSNQIWAQKSGSCADFAHVFLALCRQSGLNARYVAGFNPAQGLLHAWCEVIIDGKWRAFDPTHGRAPLAGCVAVATGRDFADCAPHLGHFRGNARADLQMKCVTTISA